MHFIFYLFMGGLSQSTYIHIHHMLAISTNMPKTKTLLEDLCQPRKKMDMMKGLIQCSANYIPLSPITFLERAAFVYGDNTSIVYGSLRFSWKETHQRCLNLASALLHFGISRHDVVSNYRLLYINLVLN